MTYQDDDQNPEQEYRRFNGKELNRIVAILFVMSIYVFIFLKILFLE